MEVGYPTEVWCPKYQRNIRGTSHTVLWTDTLNLDYFTTPDRE
jgi:hypothetical protein